MPHVIPDRQVYRLNRYGCCPGAYAFDVDRYLWTRSLFDIAIMRGIARERRLLAFQTFFDFPLDGLAAIYLDDQGQSRTIREGDYSVGDLHLHLLVVEDPNMAIVVRLTLEGVGMFRCDEDGWYRLQP